MINFINMTVKHNNIVLFDGYVNTVNKYFTFHLNNSLSLQTNILVNKSF